MKGRQSFLIRSWVGLHHAYDHFRFERIPFPGLPKLCLSATCLVKISLLSTPHSGYISPEAMATCLSTLAGLAELELSFAFPLSRPNWENRRPPPLTRSILPALRHFGFVRVSEYLEDLVARTDSPLLDSLQIKFFHQLIFDTPQPGSSIAHQGLGHAKKHISTFPIRALVS